MQDYAFLVKYNYAKGDHITRFVNRNDPLLGSPWSTGLGAGGTNGIGVLTVDRVDGARATTTASRSASPSGRRTTCQFQVYYTYSKDKSDDDNERDPFTFRYAKITDLGRRVRLLRPRPASPRERLAAVERAAGVDVNVRYAYRSAQPKSIIVRRERRVLRQGRLRSSRFMATPQTPQDRINPDGSVTQRNLGRKDNQLLVARSAPVARLPARQMTTSSRPSTSSMSSTARTSDRPEVTNLIFNFDGTVQSGVGEPRQMQLGVRLIW